MPLVTVVELKSVTRPYRAGGLDRLWSYVHGYYATDRTSGPEHRLLAHRDDLCTVLVVPCRTPTLDADIEAMQLRWDDLGGGYGRLTGGLFRLYIVEIDPVADAEDDDLLRLFGHGEERTAEARRFWAEQVGSQEGKMAVQDLEGYDEVMQKLLDTLSPEQRLAGLSAEQRLAGLAPEQRLAGLAPEQRLAGLAPEQALLAFPDVILRALSDDFIATLSEPVRAAVRSRIGRG